jgi:hypothetical protein
MSEVPPHVARLIRDKTLTAVSKANSEAMDLVDQGWEPSTPTPSISKAVRVLTNHCYKELCKKNLGIGNLLYLNRRKPKNDLGFCFLGGLTMADLTHTAFRSIALGKRLRAATR